MAYAPAETARYARLSAKIEMEFATHKFELATGDSIYFSAQIPQRI
jgi:hypothetical protein